MIEHQIAQGLDEEPPLLALHHGRTDLPDERLGHLPALAQFCGYLVDLLFLASERGEGNRFDAHAPQMLKNLGKCSPAFRKQAVDLLQNLRRQPAEG